MKFKLKATGRASLHEVLRVVVGLDWRHRFAFGLTFAVILCLAAFPAYAHPPTVHVSTGLLAGVSDVAAGVDAFKGVPYAAPPVGRMRWRPPVRPRAWEGTRTADRFGPRCMQRRIYDDMVFRSAGMGEDCLYLNVWTPSGSEGRKHLPVLVYFFGGGFVAGDGSEPRYDGTSLARHGIVVVTVNYRLGVFGFLALPALADESPHGAAGNYGLLDQVAALRWVQHNIAAFGGDPQEVTLGGESAGSISVSALMASPLSKGLMQRAIGESGAMLANLAPMTLQTAESRGEAFANAVDATSLAQLRALPAAALLAAAGSHTAPHFGPDVDGYFLRQAPVGMYEHGGQAHIPLLVGSNSEEGSYVDLLDNDSPTPAHYRAVVDRQFGARAGAALALYPGNTVREVKASGTALSGDEFIALATWRWMHLQHETGGSPVYYYYFTKARPATMDGSRGPGAGAVHSGEIEYALGNLSRNHVYAWTDADRKVSAVMTGYFVNFIKTGDPNGPGLPAWPAVVRRDGGLLRQVIGVDTHTRVDRNAARYEFLLRSHYWR